MSVDLKKEKRRSLRKKAEVKSKAKKETQGRDKRHEMRRDMAHSQRTVVEIPLPFPKGVKIIKEVTDFSDKGLAFKMAREEGFLLPGTTIKDLAIYYNGTKVEKPSAEVMYAVPIAGNDSFKIGIKFTGSTSKRSALGREAVTHAVRPFRHDLSIINKQQKLVRFTDHTGQNYTGSIKNISSYGLAFELEKPENAQDGVLKLSDTIEQFQVVIGGETAYNGKVIVANLRTVNNKLIVGASLWDKSVDIQKILNQRLEKTDAVVSEMAPIIVKIEKVQQVFKSLVADMRIFLESVQTNLVEEERKACNQGMTHKKMIEQTVLMRFEQPVYQYLDRLMRELNKQVDNFDEEQHAYHREYFQKQVGNLVWLSPFVKRAYLKPLGYAGDYEMMDMIYRDPYEGDTLFAKLLNKYYCHHIPPAQASRNRIPYLLQKIEQASGKKARAQKQTHVLSVACGPANEVVEFIKNNEASSNATVTLVDIEPEALYFSQEMALTARAEAKRNAKINIFYLPLQQLLKETKKLKALENQALIYSAGLFEYLSDSVCKKMIATLYDFLGKDGMLVIGNFDPRNEFKCCMEYCAEWYLIYRTQADLLKLAHDAIGAAPNIYCEADPTGINNFLIVKK